MTNDVRTGARARALGLLMMIPSISVAIGLVAIEGYRAIRPDAPLFGDPPETFVGAVLHGDQGLEGAYAFIAAGQDPNAPIDVNDEHLSGGRVVAVSPLVLAVAARNDSVVEMLLAFGARPDLPQNRRARCLARTLGLDKIATILESARGSTSVPCPPRAPDDGTPPLVAID